MMPGILQDPSPEKKQFQGLINSLFLFKFQHIFKKSGIENEKNKKTVSLFYKILTTNIIIQQIHYEKSDWSRAFNQ